MPASNDRPTDLGEKDILFECGHCGRSLAIDYRGAGLMIRCPSCNEEIQVPIPEGMDLAEIDRGGAVEVKGVEDSAADMAKGPSPLPETPEQIKTLMTELEELRFRRRYLEKKRADDLKWLQAMTRQLTVIRTALDQIEDILKNLSEQSAEDTQRMS